jgi:hypothetical protein
MGISKRIITKDTILFTDNDNLNKLFSADCFIFDNWSYEFYELFLMGFEKEQIIKKLNNH